MSAKTTLKNWLASGTGIVILLSVLKLVFHLVFSGGYGYFRDEFYYLAVSQYLDFGYLEFPPGIALIAALARTLFGTSTLALRFFPAIAGAGVIFLTGRMARELGGGRYAQGLAALAALIAPVFLGTASVLTMDAFDQFFWILSATLLLRLLKRDEPRLWLWFGAAVGLGLMFKVTILYFVLAMVLGLVLIPAWKYFKSRWLYLGGVIALLVFSPYIVWQVLHGFPTLEFWQSYATGKTYPVTPWEFIFQQVYTLQPITLPVWLAGLWFYFFTKDGKSTRPAGWIYAILFFVFMLQQAKFYFLAAAYPMLFAAGAFWFEQLAARKRRWYWVRDTLAYSLAIGGVLAAPLAVPILPVEMFIKYSALFGVSDATQTERLETAELPQQFADQFGWPEKVQAVAQAYADLPPDERSRACIFTGNYGEAGALEFWSDEYGLPPVISGHNQYFLWGPGGCSGEVIITLGVDVRDLTPFFDSVEQVGIAKCQYCMPYENNLPIYVCRGLQIPLDQAWPAVKHYD